MADLHIENLRTTEQFAALLAALDVRLPLFLHEEAVGVVLDADMRDVLVIDVNGERDDDQATQIASWIVLAVNTCGGFRAERSHG